MRENIVFVFTLTPLLMIDKKGEKYFSIYACLGKDLCLCINVLFLGEKGFDVFHACLCMFISLYLHTCLFMHVLHCHILFVYLVCMS